MQESVRSMLNCLDSFFMGTDKKAAYELWNVLSALRGPDDDDALGVFKASTTNHVRRAAFPRCAAAYDKAWHVGTSLNFGGLNSMTASFAVLGTEVVCSKSEYPKREHFLNHILKATLVLGIPFSTTPAP